MPSASIVVIGAGPAGIAAGIQCRRLGVPAVVLEREPQVGGLVRNGFLVENYPGLGKPVSGTELARRLARDLERWDVGVIHHRVECVVPGPARFVVETSGMKWESRAVIVATGTRAKQLAGAPMWRDGVKKRVFHQVTDLRAAFPRPKEAVVVGGGEAACDYALSLAELGAMVRLWVRGSELKACPPLSHRVFASPRIRIQRGTTLAGVTHRAEGIVLEGVANGQAMRVSADVLLVAIGRESSTNELLPGLDLSRGAPKLTGQPGLFVAGDARLGSLGQVAVAVGDGLQAAQAAVQFVKSRVD